MESAKEIAQYVFGHYPQLMNDVERRAHRHQSGAMKATLGRSDVQAQLEARTHHEFSTWLSNDPEVLSVTASGYDAFVERVAARIVNEHADQVFFNRCSECGGLARTPTARQCRFCGHDWHV